jgi:hypothetical protein
MGQNVSQSSSPWLPLALDDAAGAAGAASLGGAAGAAFFPVRAGLEVGGARGFLGALAIGLGALRVAMAGLC